jgi:hypothetical protein
MFVPHMDFYVVIDANSRYHVQNILMGHDGQHHVHTKESFAKWKKNVDSKDIHISKTKAQCDCGLMPGDVRDHEGHVSHNDRFGD